ncbi:MAG: EAL domain-containing protein [Clostridia bacterium]|nr:EAL domain-containing protein [Clostridia bacterium]
MLSCFVNGIAGGEESLVIGVPVDRCPVFYQENGRIMGIGVDLMRLAAENAGYTPSFKAIEEPTLKDALDNDAYDLILPFGGAVSSTSGHPTLVSDNLTQTPFTLVTVGEQPLPPFNSLRVGMLRSLGGATETVNELYPGMTIVMYDSMAASVKALRSGEVNGLLHNSYVWSYVLQKPSYSDLTVQPATMFTMDFRAGVPDTEAGRKRIERLNEGIAVISDMRRRAVTLDYTSRRLYHYSFDDYLYQSRHVLVLAAMLLAVFLVIAVKRLNAYRKMQEEKLQKLLNIDPLTGALTLGAFKKRVDDLLRRHPDTPYLLTYTNIRNFKFINDSLGRSAGDELLKFWVQRTKVHLTDDEAICRIVADHFAIIRRIREDDQISADEKRVVEPVRNYFIERGKENKVQLCSGIYALTPEDYERIDVERMLDFARLAEQKVRDTRKDGYEFYNPEQWKRGKQVADVCGHLPVAIQSGELQVWYQPQIDYITGKIIGAEALCRWNHRRLGWLRPSEFIPVLEDAGLIYDMDCFIWESVCQNLQKWGKDCFVSVNLSRCDIREDRNIPGYFYDLTQKYGLSPDQLRIEITESAYTQDPELLTRTTEKLRSFGFQVEMDDFGSGYSSLHMLKEVPVDRIKLDLNFLSGAGDPERGRIIVSHVVQMIRSLGMNLIAEGVENVSQAEFLKSRGCNEMQGFYFYKSMPVHEFEAVMRQGRFEPVPTERSDDA